MLFKFQSYFFNIMWKERNLKLMLLVVEVARSVQEILRITPDRYPNRVILSAKAFRMLHGRLCVTKSFNKNTGIWKTRNSNRNY